jgi:hypothetical protein
MAYEANVAENVDCLEVYPADEFDRARINPEQVEGHLKNRLRNELKVMLEEIAGSEADEQIGALRYERGIIGRADYRNGYRARNLGTRVVVKNIVSRSDRWVIRIQSAA